MFRRNWHFIRITFQVKLTYMVIMHIDVITQSDENKKCNLIHMRFIQPFQEQFFWTGNRKVSYTEHDTR